MLTAQATLQLSYNRIVLEIKPVQMEAVRHKMYLVTVTQIVEQMVILDQLLVKEMLYIKIMQHIPAIMLAHQTHIAQPQQTSNSSNHVVQTSVQMEAVLLVK